MGLNDNAWQAIFDRYSVLEQIRNNGYFIISANQIKEYREPRLMTKFDHQVNLPQLFIENSLAILPITRGDYIISPFVAYKNFETPVVEKQRVSMPDHLQSFMPEFILSEAIALNCAYACGILSDFLEDENIVSTVSGRMGSGSFDFEIASLNRNTTVSVNNSQIEIDAAYEGVNYLSLFEAKRDISDDFLVRQLYYPYRVWSSRVTKPIKSNFLVFSNGVFYLYEYRFEQLGNYNSLRLIKQKNYVIDTEITMADIEHRLTTVRIEDEPPVAFPQANVMSRIINLVELLNGRDMTKEDITDEYAFDSRQTNYYTDAGRYLGLIDKSCNEENVIVFKLSEFGKYIMRLNYRDRQLAIATQILKHKAFNETLKVWFRCGSMPDCATIMGIMQNSNLYQVKADSTYYRRSSTVIRWLNWIIGLIE